MAHKIPDKIRDEIITELYRQAAELDWHLLTQTDKAEWYTRWVDAPNIGVKLQQFLDPARVRVWIKDVPMKEFARAEEGIGSYAKYVTSRVAGGDEIIRRVLGEHWAIIQGSAGIKPQHCLVADVTASPGSKVTRYVCWGPQKDIQHLVWAALCRAIDMSSEPLIVVTTRDSETVSAIDRREHEKLARRCGIEIKYFRRETTVA